MTPLLNLFETVGDFAHFAWQALLSAIAAIAKPKDWLLQLYSVLIGALPLATVAGISLGAVVWLQTYSALKRSGTEEYLPTVLAAAVLLELAPIGAGLIVAARTGASLGAELGAMKQGEQLDALELLGLPPMRVLVGPRVLACILALPLLHVFIAVLALMSGYVAENIVGNTNWQRFQTASLRELVPHDVIPAALKTTVFGFLIGVSGCYYGMKAEGGTEGVGRAATAGVVAACLLVLAADVLLVGLIQALVA